MPNLRVRRLSLAMLLALLATASPLAAERPGPGGAVNDEPVVVFVENVSGADIAVYVVRANSRFRVGRLRASERARFEVPAGLVSGATIRLVAVRTAHGVAVESEPFTPRDGEHLTWRVIAMPSLSSNGWATLLNSTPADANRWALRRF